MDQDVLSFLSFWLEAGVDTAYSETALDRRRFPGGLGPAAPALEAPPQASDGAALGSADAAGSSRSGSLALTLQELEGEVEGLRRSRTKSESGGRTLLGRGPERAEVVLIGEAATAADDKAGVPFAGRAGALLDRMLAACGLADAAYLTNTVFWPSPGDRPASRDDQLACRPFLERAVALIRPRLVVILGAGPANFLLDLDGGVIALRGRAHLWSLGGVDPGLPTFVTFSPEILLRRPTLKKQVWFDLLAAREALQGVGSSRQDKER